jgi:hypothetical protein
MKKLVLFLIGLLSVVVLINAFIGTKDNQENDGTSKDPIVLFQEDSE